MLEKIRTIICEYADIQPDDIIESTNLRTDLNLNSLDRVNIAVNIEDAFNIVVDEKLIASLFTVKDIMDYIVQKGVSE